MADPKETKKFDHVLSDFQGVNTQSSRQTIKESRFSWLENLMPIGFGNLKTVPAPRLVATILGQTVYYTKSVNLSGADLLLCFCASGAAYKVDLSTFVVTQFAAVGQLSGSGVRVDTWNGSTVVLVCAAGYFTYDGTTLANIGGITGAPTSGTSIAVFSGRVWIASGRTVTYSAPNSFSDFQTASFGGSFLIQDATLHSDIIAMSVANNFLYVFGVSSINVISDVRVVTVGASTSTVLSNTNVSSSLGTVHPGSIVSYYRSLWFANSFGFYSLYGATTQKASDDLDGVFAGIVDGKVISAGLAVVYRILVLAFLFRYLEGGNERGLLAVFFNKKWFFCSQGDAINYIEGAVVSGVPSLFGSDGGATADSHIYKLFDDASAAIFTRVQTGLWDMDQPLRDKQVLKVGIELNSSSLVTLDTVVDTESNSEQADINAANTLSWVNQFGDPITFVGTGPITWVSGGYLFLKTDASHYGKYVGMTVESQTPNITYSSFRMQYELRANW